jgi:hypothetical protein
MGIVVIVIIIFTLPAQASHGWAIHAARANHL